jgi:hypothetical protein
LEDALVCRPKLLLLNNDRDPEAIGLPLLLPARCRPFAAPTAVV